MKNVIYIFLFSISFFDLKGQTYGNEWIEYDQKYYTFNVISSGIYRLDYSTLFSSGIPVNQFSSSNIQIFGRENEIPLLIEDGGDNILNEGDYILFYAQRNDGWLDSMLYEEGGIGNPKYSLYNDTIQYFFTWNSSSNNLRIVKETDQSIDNYTTSNFVTVEKSIWYNNKYNEGEKSSQASSSLFKKGEGWGNNAVNGVNGYTWNITSLNLDNVFNGAGAPDIRYQSTIYGASNATDVNNIGNHHSRHTIGTSNYPLVDTIFKGYNSVLIDTTFPASIMGNNPTNFKISIVGDLNVATDYQSINYVSFTYPHTLNFSGENKLEFSVQNAISNSKIRLDFNGLACSSPIMLTLGDNQKWIPLILNNGLIQGIIPNSLSENEQKVIISDASEIMNVSSLMPVNSNGLFTNFQDVIDFEEALLFIYPQKLQNKALEYAMYRTTQEGGSYNVVTAKIEELYQQFGGGITKHINGVRRFAHFGYNKSTIKPVGLFLVGKGIREANITSITSIGPGSRTNAAAYENNLIPSFGQPSCDQCITSNLPETNRLTPLIPTGRISVLNEDELQIYLSKVIEYEAHQNQNAVYNTQTKDWQKHILHFSGGSSLNEQQQLQGYLNQMGEIAEGNYFAGKAQLVAKDSQDPISPTELEQIKNRIADGVSVMNFFGHFSTTGSGFDINLDEPQYWNNQSKYPILIANSCYNGNIFHNSTSNSQTFTLVPNAGVIAYIGSINYGFTSSLNAFSTQFYKQFSEYNYGGTIGSHIRNVMDSILPNTNSLITESTFSQFTLNGDPMIRINYHNKPEIELTESRVSFGPTNISLATDSIEITITLKNLGKSIVDTFNVQITRDFPSSTVDSLYLITVPGMNYETILNVKIPFQPTIGIGLNKFQISTDIPSIIPEQYDEITNNQIIKSFFIDIDGIQPILPFNFEVVPSNKITLSASTINPLADYNTYRFEIDTTHTFSSSFKKLALVSGNGGLKQVNYNEWTSTFGQPDSLILEDSIVYFWRVALDENQMTWKNSSFQYIPNKQGWGQAKLHQFLDNNFVGLTLNEGLGLREFQPISSQITCLVKSTTQSPGHYYNAWTLNGIQQDYDICNLTPKFHVAIIDKASLTPWETRYTYSDGTVANPDNNFGNQNDNGGCAGRPMKFFTYHQNNVGQINSFQNLVENIVPNGDYILIYSPMTTRYDWWNLYDPGLYETFQNLGSDSIYPGVIRPNRPFAFLTRKGDPSFVVEIFSQNYEDIYIDTVLTGLEVVGYETSPTIGPVNEFKSFFWNHSPLESNSSDSTRIKIDVYNNFLAYQYSIDTLIPSGDSITNLNNLIDDPLFPYLKLKSIYRDNATQTPSQLKNWHVLFSPLPEAAVDSIILSGIQANDTLQEGQKATFSVGIKNIGNVPMDSLLISYYILDANQQKHYIPYPRQDSLRVNQVFVDTIEFDTRELVGLNYLYMEVNPYVDLSQTILDQPELSHFNNIVQLPFYVVAEEINPILDVTFDGRRIMNEDIISPNAEILITLKDENPYLVLNEDADTSRFGIYLTKPNGSQIRIPFVDGQGNNVMYWTPANESNLKFKIEYPAEFEDDGIYELFIQGADKSGNLSGDLEYRIRFEIIHESTISQMINYPNPFSTSTKFAFTITGSEVPDNILIQIMTISGKVIRQIDETELGPLFIGRNITEYGWDGRDQFGDIVANGVYLYRIKAQIDGKDIKQLKSGADQYFKNGFGKMYLIR